MRDAKKSGRSDAPLRKSAPTLGILALENPIPRPPGDVGHPASYPGPVLIRTVPGATIDRLVRRGERALLGPLLEAARELVAQGAAALTSTCGFFILFQAELAAALPVPTALSSLLQLPLLQRIFGPGRPVGIITAHAAGLTQEHLRLAGADLSQPLPVVGLEGRPAFAAAILDQTAPLDQAAVQAEVTAAAEELTAQRPDLGAILLECSNLPPYAAAVQAATGRPVFDFLTLIDLLLAGVSRRPFPAGPVIRLTDRPGPD